MSTKKAIIDMGKNLNYDTTIGTSDSLGYTLFHHTGQWTHNGGNTTIIGPGSYDYTGTAQYVDPHKFEFKPSFTGVYIGKTHVEWSLLRKMGTKVAIIWACLRKVQEQETAVDWTALIQNANKSLGTITTTIKSKEIRKGNR